MTWEKLRGNRIVLSDIRNSFMVAIDREVAAVTASNVRKVYISGFLFNVSFLAFAILIPLDALAQHLPVLLVGVLAAVPGILQLPMRILSGPLVDRLGERWVLGVTFTLATLAGGIVTLGPSSSMLSLILGQLCIGAARGLFWPAAQSEVSREPENRARALGLFTSFTKGGALIGTAAAGGIAQIAGIRGGFAFSAALGLISLVMGATLPKTLPSARPSSLSAAIYHLLPAARQPFVIVNGLVAVLCAIPQSLAQSFYPVALIQLGLKSGSASLITALTSFGMIISGFFGAWALRRMGMRPVVMLSAGSIGLALGATAVHQIALDAVAIFIGGFFAGWLNIAFLTAVSSRSHDGDRGTNLGVTQAFFVLAFVGTPLISGWLFGAIGRAGTFEAEGVLGLSVGLLIMTLWRWQEQSTPAGNPDKLVHF
ncbi:MAG: MFS transporter [Firmicutes bacterium]|uniref:Major facilitator superfamily (MFS) profile domain-containing protein n=1 Tax=Sulfobacillus benefaciens TaxID=453960 RepID=A0A2T2XA27_9FIRM|nr:MFS transporter [Bacillota bacterium]PSR31342.1 MAG: hypothetical protein C7B43_02955 [Sulfobacillus benefaciens]